MTKQKSTIDKEYEYDNEDNIIQVKFNRELLVLLLLLLMLLIMLLLHVLCIWEEFGTYFRHTNSKLSQGCKSEYTGINLK
jgi:hypothetical protein